MFLYQKSKKFNEPFERYTVQSTPNVPPRPLTTETTSPPGDVPVVSESRWHRWPITENTDIYLGFPPRSPGSPRPPRAPGRITEIAELLRNGGGSTNQNPAFNVIKYRWNRLVFSPQIDPKQVKTAMNMWSESRTFFDGCWWIRVLEGGITKKSTHWGDLPPLNPGW